MLIARAFSGFSIWIKLYINSCKILKNGPLCGPLTFDRSPNMVRRSACVSASFFYGKSGFSQASEYGIRYHGLPEGEAEKFDKQFS